MIKTIIVGVFVFVVVGLIVLEGIPALVRRIKAEEEAEEKKEKERKRQKQLAEQQARAQCLREEERRKKEAEIERLKRSWQGQVLYQKLLEICVKEAKELCVAMERGDCESYWRAYQAHGISYEIEFDAGYEELVVRKKGWVSYTYRELGYELPENVRYEHLRALTFALGDGLKKEFDGNSDVTVNVFSHDYSDGPETRIKVTVKYKTKLEVVDLPD